MLPATLEDVSIQNNRVGMSESRAVNRSLEKTTLLVMSIYTGGGEHEHNPGGARFGASDPEDVLQLIQSVGVDHNSGAVSFVTKLSVKDVDGHGGVRRTTERSEGIGDER